ncbi:MAG: 1-acyl-sn-glycerol-3-phosphate acyltransferase [Bacteroidota bacterium]|nr:1-acyl-sn-glycerol-3-phosphate acyltransferase [Bacteroidota bacterium]
MFRKDPFGHKLFLKRWLISFIGWLTWRRYARRNRITISGTEHLENLPASNVLFVSNHQTYFAEVIALLHVFCAVKNGYKNSISKPWYLFRPRINTYFVAAEETMKKGILPRVFAYAGSVSIQRTWRDGGVDVNRKVRMEDLSNIGHALDDGWVINFPQGTTKPGAKGRRGITVLVKKYNPVVIPVVIDGFRNAFDKKGLRMKKKKGVKLSIRFKAPLQFEEGENGDVMLVKVMDAIEQSDRFVGVQKQEAVVSGQWGVVSGE